MTRREAIFDILKKEEKTAQQLANHFAVELPWIIEDLEHLRRSVRPRYRLMRKSAYCKKCGFLFKERSRIKAPTKCPKCKSEWIQASLFRLQRA